MELKDIQENMCKFCHVYNATSSAVQPWSDRQEQTAAVTRRPQRVEAEEVIRESGVEA